MDRQPRILIVDDDRFSRTIVKDVLDQEGYLCFEACDGQEGINSFLSLQPDLILMDVEMPKVNGILACAQIKSLPNGADTPVIFITARESEDFIATAFSAGGEDYVLKPVNIHVLFRRIQRILEHRSNSQRLVKQNNLLNLMQNISFQFLATRNAAQILREILLSALKMSGAEVGLVFLLDESGDFMKLVAHEGISVQSSTELIMVGQYQTGIAWQTKQRLVIPSYKDWPLRSLDPNFDQLEMTVAYPLKIEDHVVGVLALAYQSTGKVFTEAVLMSLEQISNLAALIVDNSRMFMALQKEIEERIKIQNEVQIKNAELSQTLAKLKQAQGQMIQQEKMAGIGQLAAGVAHEINNPLGFVTSNFDTLEKYTQKMILVIQEYQRVTKSLADQHVELQSMIEDIVQFAKNHKLSLVLADLPDLFAESKDGLERVGKIVQALRFFSRVDRQNQFEDYDLNGGLETTLVMARNEIKYVADVELELGEVPVVQAIGGQINQVLLNLLVNAAQAIQSLSSDRKGLIKVRTFTEGKMVGCSIHNDGPPIPQEIQSRIFEPFFTTKPVGKGTGLGLSISYDIIVNRHQGKLFFTSDEANGTEFVIKIPQEIKS